MRRGPIVAAASAAGLAGVLALHSARGPTVLTGPVPAAAGTGATGATTSTTGSPAGSTSTTQPANTGGPTGTQRSAKGAVEQYGYGELGVKVTVAGGKISEVTVPVLQTAEPYSQSLAQQVIPMLHNEVLAAQSARINGISGATYTSEAYAYSVQAALDALHFK